MNQTLSLFIEWKTETEELLDQVSDLSALARQIVDDDPRAEYFHSAWWQSRKCKVATAGHDCMADTYLLEDADAFSIELVQRLNVKPLGRRAKVFLLWDFDADSEKACKRRRVSASDFLAEDLSLKGISRQLKSDDPIQVRNAIRALGRAKEEAEFAVPLLAKLLAHDDNRVAEAAAAALRDIGPAAAKAVPTLLSMRDTRQSDQLRYSVQAAITFIGPPALKKMKAMLLKDPSVATGSFARCFEVFGWHEGCLDLLIPLLKHKDARVRQLSMKSISSAGSRDRRLAIEVGLAGLHDPSRKVTNAAYRLLHRAGKAAVPRIRTALKKETDKFVCKELNSLLSKLDPPDLRPKYRAQAKQLQSIGNAIQVELSAGLLKSLQLNAWNKLTTAKRAATLKQLSAALKESGTGLKSGRIKEYGPKGDTQPIAEWVDASNNRFVLVPGGSFRPGFTKSQITQVQKILDSEKYGETFKLNPKRLRVFDNEFEPNFCDISQKATVQISPFIMAGHVVHNIPSSVKELPKKGPTQLIAHDLIDIVTNRGWSLPSSNEFEWAISGGRRTLFHWGDSSDGFLEKEYVDQTLKKTQWPYCTRFGLSAPLDMPTWCQPESGGRRLVWRGGSFFPWQWCGEWMLYLIAVQTCGKTDDNGDFFAAIRPVIRLT